MKICPFCDGELKDDAIRCWHCSMVLPRPKVAKQDTSEQKVSPPEVSKIAEEPPPPTPSEPLPPPKQSTFSTPNIEEKAAIAEILSKPSSQQSTVSTPNTEEKAAIAEIFAESPTQQSAVSAPKIIEEPKVLEESKTTEKPRIIEEPRIISEPPSRPSPKQSTVDAPHKEETKIKNETLYEAFIGKRKHNYYLNKFKIFDEQPQGGKVSWNWAAFFGNYIWALYRKMYGWFFACFGLVAFLAIYPYYLKYYKGSAPEIYSALLYICIIAFSILFGTIGNSLYYRAVKKKIAAAQSSITDKPELLEFLRNKGGVQTWLIWVCILALILLLFASAYIVGVNAQEINYLYLPIYAATIIGAIVTIVILYSHVNLGWEIKFQEILDDRKEYIIAAAIVVPILILAASILLTLSSQNKNKEQASVAPPAPVTDQSIGPTFEESLEKFTKEKRYNAIISAHPDFDSLRDSGKIVEWIQKQPGHLRESMLKTYNEGDADSVIALLNKFKNDRSSAQTRKKNPKRNVSVTYLPDNSGQQYKEIKGGIRGIELKTGNIIHGQVISFDGNTIVIRTEDGRVSSYMFMEEVRKFIY